MASNVPELQNSFELLKEDLECPVCMDVPESLPIYQCLQGHIICNVCYPKVDNCPVCRVGLSLQIRALTAEKILRKMLTECKHEGCFKLKMDIREHEASCEYALAKCDLCNKKFLTKDLALHFETCTQELSQEVATQFIETIVSEMNVRKSRKHLRQRPRFVATKVSRCPLKTRQFFH